MSFIEKLTQKFIVNVGANRINKFDEQWYQVLVNGEMRDFRSVTTTLDVFPKGIGFKLFLQKYGDDADKIRNEAGQLGSHVHKMIELTLRGGTPSFENEDGTRNCSLEEWERYLSWCLWFKDAGLTPLFVEQIVHDVKEKDAGTVDLIAEDKRNYITLADWKTGSFVGDTAEIQVSRYGEMAVKMNLVPRIDRFLILQLYPTLNKKGYREHEVENPSYWNDLYMNTAALWKHLNKNAKPKYRIYPNAVNLEFIQNNQIIEGV